MILRLNRQSLLLGVQGGAFGYRPTLEDSVKFQAQIVVQRSCLVLLDYESPLRFLWSLLPRGFGRYGELTLATVFIQTHKRLARQPSSDLRRSGLTRFLLARAFLRWRGKLIG